MLTFLGENYYLDVTELERQVSYENSVLQVTQPTESENSDQPEQQISVTRYETFKSLIDVVLTEREELDESLGIHGAKDLTIPFKIAFNTLLINKIIKKF
jgi:hypothetical protein